MQFEVVWASSVAMPLLHLAMGQQATAVVGLQDSLYRPPQCLGRRRLPPKHCISGVSRCHSPWLRTVHRINRSRVSTGASTAFSSSNTPTNQQYIQHPVNQTYGPQPSAVTVTWPGLLAALALAATALVAAATTCFFLYIKPVMQAMSVTLTEMEAAAKEMQQAAHEVEELVGGVNNAIKQVMQPTSSLLKWAPSMPSSSASSPQSSTDGGTFDISRSSSSSAETASSSGAVQSDATAGSSPSASDGAAASAAASAGPSSSVAWQLTDQLEGLAPTLLDSIRSLQRLQLSDLGAAALKLSGLEEAAGKQQQQQEQRTRLRRVAQATSSSSSSNSNSNSQMVWDMLASSVSTRATRRSLARLRSDLAAAANVLNVLLAPPSRRLYEQIQQDEQQQLQSTQPPQVQQQQVSTSRSMSLEGPEPLSGSDGSTAGAAQQRKGSTDSSSGSSTAATLQTSSRGRRAVQVDEWGLPITAAELASFAAAAPVPDQDTLLLLQQACSSQPAADIAQAAAPSMQQQQQQGQQQRQQHSRRGGAVSSGDDESWHLDLSQYGSYLEQEHSAVTSRTDSGITWQQLQKDASLMQRVFCDNQEWAFAEQANQQGQPQQPQQPEQQQQPRQTPHEQTNCVQQPPRSSTQSTSSQ